ncbi:uncharacterized protein LOC111312853 [Durio zibethinus]|uniref:Uncharacterized protein LOC111312853 n=1 Tax=Durio zibethinus TaxID=66656 RepID=A0A6P6AWM9_DURZI|nr:uncharacterized protein LOC111312853 [Durio zibethinus]XP_022769272.1 uncharacterized protein LOC111312853 [Durio zibethinus]XP_022769281.1 uncharacterized protein LOC111312853 [Durio zibethinus]
MDSWLVAAAAAAAGYFAKYWQNLSRDRNDFPEFSSVDSRIGKVETAKGFRKFSRRRKLQEDVSLEGRADSDFYGLIVASAAEVDSASGFDAEKVGSLGNHTDRNVISLSNLVPGFLTNENLRDQCGKGPGVDSGGNSAKPSSARVDSFNEPMRKRSSLKTKYSYGHLLKPRSSLDGCLMAQLYMQHVKMEEYILSSLPSSSSTPILRRPLLITDGSRIINKASGDFSNESNGTGDSKLHDESTFEKSGYVFGIPPLPKIESLDLPKKLKFKRGTGCDGRLSIPCKMDTEKQFHSQWGSRDGAVLFCLGISIGIISSYIGNRREVEKLRGLLKKTENLVQDLQEELEMKDSLTVKEIAYENYESGETYDNSFHGRATNSSSLELNMDNLTRYDGKESYCEKVGESSESMSKIEAELAAELERLGLNMNVSNFERRLSDLVELDPDFVADFAEGELRSDMVNCQALVQSVSNEDRSGTLTTHSGNYAVSPRELSLRLHKVIESRLEERIQELETALQNSQRKVKLMESEHKNSWKISNSECKYSSTLESPQINDDFDCMSKPLVMKLSGEALDAYNEACEELLKVDESEEEDAPSDIYQNNHREELHKGYMSWGCQNAKNTSEEPFHGEGRTREVQPSRVQELLDVGASEDECSDYCDDEMEKQLIQQILEKTKKGSPVLLNAQRILFSMDEI